MTAGLRVPKPYIARTRPETGRNTERLLMILSWRSSAAISADCARNSVIAALRFRSSENALVVMACPDPKVAPAAKTQPDWKRSVSPTNGHGHASRLSKPTSSGFGATTPGRHHNSCR
jgi:hypothetical protein